MTRPPTIVAMGGGGFEMEPDNPLLDDHVLALARARAGRERPRVCLIPTASHDDDGLIADFERLFASRAEQSVLRLFNRTDDDLRSVVLGQDAVYVTGGNTANLFALRRRGNRVPSRARRCRWRGRTAVAGPLPRLRISQRFPGRTVPGGNRAH